MNWKVTLHLLVVMLLLPLVSFTQTCDNATDGGEIGYDQTLCYPGADPAPLVNITLPSGGSGYLEYVWIFATTNPYDTTTVWEIIPGSTGADFDPGPVNVTTYFRRCARRAGCVQYLAESNIIRVCVDEETPVISYVPADATIECDQDVVFGYPEYSDDCDTDLSVTYTDEVTGDVCNLVHTRTWRVEDDCGNYAEASQSITTIDTTAPTISLNPPYENAYDGETITVECDAIPHFTADDASATDNCDEDVTISLYYHHHEGDCLEDGYLEIISNEWTATDDCGNYSTFTLNIKVVDTTDPVFTYVPADETIECDQDVVFGTPEFEDNCDDDLDLYYHDEVTGDDCTQVHTRTWTITDDCGNTASASQSITSTDTTDPVFTYVPADETIECDQDVVFGTPQFEDNCDDDLDVYYHDDYTGDDCTQVHTRTWTITDNCGNTASASQSITVTDTTDPVFTYVPADETIECDQDVVFGTPQFEDNCDDDLDIYYHDEVTGDDCTQVHTRTWTITDNCGNTASASQSITVTDTTDPVFTYVPADETIECDQDVVFGMPQFEDNCDDDLDVYYHDEVTGDDCTQVHTRTWTITDNCGNTASASQSITVTDTTDPVFTYVPADETIECDQDVVFGTPEFTDNCDDDLDVYYHDEVTGDDCTQVHTRTWTITDNCGNTASASQSITVTDTTDPVFTYVPADETIECDEDVVFGTPEFEDNCDDDLDIYYHDDYTGDECTQVHTRTWTITDNCGNTASASQSITVTDTTDPVFTYVPADETIECDQDVVFGTPEFEDNCDDDLDVYYHDEVTGDDCTQVHTRTWTITDNCGNTASASQSITVTDTTDPVFTYVPADETIECDQTVYFGTPEFTDNCDDDIDIYYHDEVTGDDCTQVHTRTWTITDNCGNTASASQSITVTDTTDPVFTYFPADETIECDEDLVFGTPEFDDNCDDDLDVYYHDDYTGDDCTQVHTRTWTITDNCGNYASATQTITVTDTTDPVFTYVPADETIECDQDVVFGTPEFEDNCDDDLDVYYHDEVTGDDCTQVHTRTWTITDNCGNTASASQSITVTDTTDPVFTYFPADETIECDEDLVFGTPEFTDNCDEDLDVYYHDDYTGDDCTQVHTRTWTITDNCGNYASATQTITVTDTTDPVFTYVPADETIECDEDLVFGTPEFEDNCDEDLDVYYHDDYTGDDCTQVHTRTWTITDNCGNTASASQTITVTDTTDPVFTYVPADETIECDEDLVFGTPEFTDNCDDDLDVYYHDDYTGDDCTQVHTRTWTITDNCGNTASASQTITVTDTTDPVFTYFPADETIECDQDVVFGTPEFTDNCDDDLEVYYHDDWTGDNCVSYHTRTWTITDNCGNYASATQTITSVDTTAPEWYYSCQLDVTYNTSDGAVCPLEASISLNVGDEISVYDTWTVGGIEVPSLAGCVADNCADDSDIIIRVTNKDEYSTDACTRTLTITFEADDGCGNVAGGFTCTYTFVDDSAPDISLKWPYALYMDGDTLTFECTDVPILNLYSVLVVDDCDDNPTVEFDEEVIDGNCPEDGFLTFMHCYWTATDQCGNSDVFDIYVKVVDLTAPEIVSVPADETIECDQDVVFGEPVFTDNCDVYLDVTYEDETTGDECTQVHTRTWYASDDCGNTSTASQSITVTDTTDPVFTYVPADETIECDEDLVFGTPEFEDNCDDDLDVYYHDEETGDDCTQVHTRTWTITDNCGNTASASQTITVTDTTDPVFTYVPADETIECDEDLVFGTPEFEDNCDDDLDVYYHDEETGDDCTQVHTRTWTITDNCGNTASASQTITVTDTTDPEFTYVPADETIQCDETPVFGMPEYGDNCDDDLDVSVDDYTNVVDECTTIYTRTWTITDNCGNYASATQTITATDTEGPTVGLKWPYANFMNGDTLAFECTDAPILGLDSALAEDNCDDDVEITFSEEVYAGNCPEDGYLQLMACSWTAVDNCDNYETFTIYVKIIDTTNPEIHSLPHLSVADCNSPLEILGSPEGSDNCTNDVHFTYTVDTLVSDYQIKYQVNWTASDDCGNSVDTFQVITVPCNTQFSFINIDAVLDQENAVQVKWTSVNDLKSGIYVLQRSKDGENFNYVGDQMPAQGILFTELDYDTEDPHPYKGHNYYRVQYIDARGKIYNSDEVLVTLDAEYTTAVYPNPTQNIVNVEFTDTFEEDVIVNLHARDGRTLITTEVKAGTHVVRIDMSELTAGMYFITVQTPNSRMNAIKIVKSDE